VVDKVEPWIKTIVKKNKERMSSKRSIRWNTTGQIDTIQKAVEKLNQTSQPGQRVTFNNLVADASYKAALEIIGKSKNLRK